MTDLHETRMAGSSLPCREGELRISAGDEVRKDAMTARDTSGDLISMRSIVGKYTDSRISDVTVAAK